MTRRIALAILMTVWATLIAGGAAAYMTTRAVLLADLDASLVAKALALPQVEEESGERMEPVGSGRVGDRYLIRDDMGRTVGRPATAPAIMAPQVIRAAFVDLPDGSRVRSITLRAMARRSEDGQSAPVTISYSGTTEHFDGLLRRLGLSLVAAGLFGGLLAAAIAHAVAARSLIPLRHTAEVVGTIDEKCLNRRISEENLPPELLPVAKRLNEMLGRLEESTRQRQQFIADASHELRTPVAALVTAIEVSLRRTRDAESYRQTLQTCLADAHLLKRLVEALLAQARSGLAPPEHSLETVNPADLIGQCMTVVRPLADQRSIHVSTDVAAGLVLRTEPERLRSIVLNLVGNAIEYNRVGGEVVVECRRDTTDLLLQVRDNGPGIAQEHLSHLFDPLFRVDQARSSGHLGLGLYLVRTHARAMGGECSVRSAEGVGTAFEVRLPGLMDSKPPQNSDVAHLMMSRP